MKVYAVYMYDHSMQDVVEVFSSQEKAMQYIKDDMKQVEDILIDDGYDFYETRKPNGDYHVASKDFKLFYNWALFECELR